MKIALVFPPLYGVDMPPLGIAYIAAQLLKDGHEVKVYCFNSQLYQDNAAKRFLWDWDQSGVWSSLERLTQHFEIRQLLTRWTEEILRFEPKLVGFSVNSHSRLLAELLAGGIKEKQRDIRVVFGGPWCMELLEEPLFNKNVDIYVKGEGELIASKIAEKISRQEPISDLNIPGTVVNTTTGFHDNGWEEKPLDINSLPYPALSLFNFDNYTNKTEIPIIFSRGCNYHCRFCTDKPMWGTYRMRKAEDILGEMRQHSKLFGRVRFKCNDLMVNGDLKGVEAFADAIIKEGLPFEWGGMARARPETGQEMFDKLKKAGCIYFTYGIESGARKVLSHMGKPTKRHIAQALKMTHRSGIKVNTLWMVGYPVERWIDILETMLFLFINRKHISEFVSVSNCYIPRQAWIGKQQKELGIEYDSNSDWHIGRANTPIVREARRQRLLSFVKWLGLYKGGIK